MNEKSPASARNNGERLFHLLMENVKDFAIFMLDPEGRIISWNTGSQRILGYEEPEIIGQPFGRIFVPEDIERRRPEYELLLARVSGRAEDERWHLKKYGSRFWASGVVTPLLDKNGKLRGLAKILRDITERKRAEEKLAEANQRKDEFLAMLAHELRNPLAPIQNVMQIFRQESAGKLQLQEVTAMVERSLARIVRIVDDLLDVSRVTKGKIELRKKRLPLQTAVRQALESVQPLIESRKHKLMVSMPPEEVWLEADPVRIDQIITNLLTNAAKYTEPGGKIWLNVERLGNDCVLRVNDSVLLLGIPPARRKTSPPNCSSSWLADTVAFARHPTASKSIGDRANCQQVVSWKSPRERCQLEEPFAAGNRAEFCPLARYHHENWKPAEPIIAL